MKCYQCEKPPMYLEPAGEKEIPLCLDCYLKVFQMRQMQLENSERMMNHCLDEMDALTGYIAPPSPRFPQRKTVHIGGITLHNIKINNSTVGSINTGAIGTLDIAITAVQQNAPEVAEALTRITQQVLDNKAIAQEIREEILEILSAIASEAASPKERQKVSVARTLLLRLAALLGTTADLTTLWTTWGTTLKAAFGF